MLHMYYVYFFDVQYASIAEGTAVEGILGEYPV